MHPSGCRRFYSVYCMSDLLDRIIATKKREVSALESDPSLQVHLETARQAAHARMLMAAVPEPLPEPIFQQVLRRPAGAAIRVIAECKKASPSKGLICAHYDPAAVAKQYQQLGANALSVLTDQDFFGGDLSHVQAVKASGLPALRKDFMIAPLQVAEAHRAGADAILIIVRLVDDETITALLQTANYFNMAALVEVHNAQEAGRAMQSGATIIGINHRDLDTLQMNLDLTPQIAPQIRAARPDAIIVTESGVENPQGLAIVQEYADAVLIGTALMQSSNVPRTWYNIFG